MKKRSLTASLLAVLLVALLPLVGGHLDTNQHGLKSDGVNDYIEVPDAASLQFGNSFTVSFRLNETGFSDAQLWVAKRDAGGTNYQIYHHLDGEFRFFDGIAARSLGANISDFLGNWTLVTYVVNATDHVFLYVDGVFDSSVAAAVTTDNAPLFIGSFNGADNFFNGTMDNVMIFNRTLSAVEVLSLFNGDESTLETDANLVMQLKMNEGIGQTAADSSGNGNTGTLGSTGGADANDPLWTSDCSWWFTRCDTEAAESFVKGELPSAVHTFTRFSLTSTTFIGTPHTADITLTVQSDVLLLASLQVEASTSAVAWFRLLLDDAAYLEQERIVGTEPGNMIMVDLVENVVAGTHNVEMEARVSTGTLSIVNSSILAVALHDGYGSVPAAQDFVASDTTTSNSLEDIDGLSFTFETHATSFLWIGFTFSGEVSIAVKSATTSIVYDGTLLETHEHYWATSGDKHSLFMLTRTNVKITPGLHTVKAQWSISGGTLTGENISLVAFASESNEGDREFFVGKAVGDDTTESNTLEDMDGIGLTATVTDAAHLFATLDYESSVNASSRSLFHGVSIATDSPPILERGIASSSELADAGTIRRTESKLSSDTAVQAQWYVEAATLGTANEAILTVVVLRTEKIDPETGSVMLLLAGILALFGVVAVVAMKKR